jgi:predicted transcriptional regulator
MIKITNFSPMANLYRNNFRPIVDKMFSKKDFLITKANDKKSTLTNEQRNTLLEEAKELDAKAREQWHEIVATAESL